MPDLAISETGRLPGPATDRRQALRRAAEQWEAVFLQQFLRQAHDAPLLGGDDEPLMDGGPASKTWKGLLDDSLAERAAGGMGIADMVYRELAVKAGLDRPARPTVPQALPKGGLP